MHDHLRFLVPAVTAMRCHSIRSTTAWIGGLLAAFLSLVTLPPVSGAAEVFTLDTLEIGNGFVGEHCAYTVDQAGYGQACYVSGNSGALVYAGTFATPLDARPSYGWTFETIDPLGGQHTSIASRFSVGGVWVSYARDGALWVASRTGGWTRSRLDSTGCVGSATSIVLDSGNNPHVAWWDCDQGDLKYARRVSGSWVIETVDSPGSVGASCALALTASGDPWISYRDAANGWLKFASKSSGVWSVVTVDARGTIDGGTSLWIDGSAIPRIAYVDTAGGGVLRYASRIAGVWSSESVDATHNVRGAVSLAAGPRIAYRDAVQGDLRLATKSGTWGLEAVDIQGDVGEYACLAAGASVSIGYLDRSRGDVKLASKSGTAWSFETVDDGDAVGFFADAAADASGKLCVAYYGATHGDLKYAEWSAGTHTVWTVDAAGDVGRQCSLALDGAGNRWIAYAGSSEVRLAKRTGPTWNIEVVESYGPSFTDIAIDPDGEPHLAYSGPAGLVHAERVAGVWQREAVAPGALAGSIALDAAGEPRIAYSVFTSGDPYDCSMWLAMRQSGTWSHSLIESGIWWLDDDPRGWTLSARPSLALAADGTPHVAYSVYLHIMLDYGVHYAVRSGGSWAVESVAMYGFYPSLLVRPSGPLLAFVGGQLTYGHREGGAWILEGVDAVGWPGLDGGAGCALTWAQGRPLIAYHDYDVSGLMLAVGEDVLDASGPASDERAGLARAWPSPWRRGGTMSFELVLGTGPGAMLEMVDVEGRRIARKNLKGLPAGPHLVHWAPDVPAPGVYFVRLLEGTRTAAAVRVVAIE